MSAGTPGRALYLAPLTFNTCMMCIQRNLSAQRRPDSTSSDQGSTQGSEPTEASTLRIVDKRNAVLAECGMRCRCSVW